MRLLVTALVVFATVVNGVASAGTIDGKPEVETGIENGDPYAELAGYVPGGGSLGGPSNGTVACRVSDTTFDDGVLVFSDPAQLEEGRWYWLSCDDLATGARIVERYFQYEPGDPPVSVPELRDAAYASLRLAHPTPATSPPLGADQLVGLPTWLWVDPVAWQPVSATASALGLSVTVRSEPTSVRWDLGDGGTVTCDGPGTPYDPSRPAADQRTDCSHVFQDRGRYDATATIVWRNSCSTSTGAACSLPTTARTTSFPVTVVERQAVG